MNSPLSSPPSTPERSPKARQVLGRIPRTLEIWGIIILILVVAVLVTVITLLPFSLNPSRQ